ncbi:ABC transporter substrate-binding protein [Arthrobacter sp. AB6]|uniref:ABC transporter substrate-binding protein n=1 Tax=Arthrobacter sp. AB6 TaxID=2962570 RepID=UPI00288211E6|nr:ABC transporter substrate-binding protein [Arthrobacter sp. AB6]MDT0196522.1 ABC transporter substrate-binding protein [Arthrobacter sp. AB6]
MSKKFMKTANLAKWLPALAVASALLLTGCGSGNTTEATAVQEKLPAEVVSSGTLRVGTSQLMGLPWSSKDASGNAQGLDPSLAAAIADDFGLKVEVVNLGWDSLIPSLQAGRVDIIMSGMLDTPQRQQAVDFVDYVKAGSGMLVLAGSQANISTLADACGITTGALKGSAEQVSAEAQSKECVAAGKQPIDLQLFPDVSSITAALDSGRIELVLNDPGVLGYLVKQNPDKYKTVGTIFNAGLVGIAVPKDSSLGPAIQEVLEKFMQDGSYRKVLTEYGFDDQTMLEKATLNGGK